MTEPDSIDSFRRVSFTSLLRRSLAHSFDFSGRSSRAELAVAFIAAVVFVPFCGLALMLAGAPTGNRTMLALNLLSMLPFPALLVRRLHDQARTAWLIAPAIYGFALWLLRTTVATAQGIDARIALDRMTWPLDWIAIAANTVMIALLVLPGTVGPNRFGPDPRGREIPFNRP